MSVLTVYSFQFCHVEFLQANAVLAAGSLTAATFYVASQQSFSVEHRYE